MIGPRAFSILLESLNFTSYGNTTRSVDDHHRRLAEAAPSGCFSNDDDAHRFLASDKSGGDGCNEKNGSISWTIGDVPIALCTAIFVIKILSTLFRKYRNVERPGRNIREHFVPNNIDYMIHRYGEWIMLMIGESILSLLIVETIESIEYYAIVALGCLTVIVLQMLKFESEPSHADGHALWRSTTAATFFSLLIQVLSMGLIAFGVSFKIMLTTVHNEQEYESDTGHRRLAGVPVITDEASASLFSFSLLVVLLSLELMLGTHKGVTKSCELLLHEIELFDARSLNWPLMGISVLKICIFTFTATLKHWATDPLRVTLMGFLVVTSMALTRIVGWGFVHHEEKIRDAVTYIASETTHVGRNFVQATHSMAKKTLVAPLLGSSNATKVTASNEELLMDQTIWETSFDSVVVINRLGLIKYVNTRTLVEFGYGAANEMIGKNVSILVGGGLAAHHHTFMERFNKNEDKTSTTIGKHKNCMLAGKTEVNSTCSSESKRSLILRCWWAIFELW